MFLNMALYLSLQLVIILFDLQVDDVQRFSASNTQKSVDGLIYLKTKDFFFAVGAD